MARRPGLLVVALLLGPALSVPPGAARAEVVGLDVTRREPVADGKAWGLAGPYEKLAGTVRFAVDPEHPANRRIVDLDLAPRGEDGRVHFRADVYVLRPADPEKGNGALLLEVPNRGGKAIVRYFGRGAARTFDPTDASDFGDAFLLERGFTLAWVGWQWDVPPERDELLGLEPVRVTAGPDGEPLEGLVRADHVFPEDATVLPLAHRGHRAYPVADPDDPRNVLTVRDERLGERRVVPREDWSFARLEEDGTVVPDRTAIHYPDGFEKGKIYEAVYVARDPVVVGLGLAAVRDFASHLRHAEDSPAPVERTLGMGISQTGRFLRHFLYQGFNRDEAGRPVFDGLLVHTAGAGRGSFNHRFGQPSRDAHPFSAFFYPTDVFPFSGRVQEDPVSGREEGLLELLREEGALPKVFFTNTGYEYWGRAASLLHTTIDGGEDLEPRPEVRIYHLAGAQHFVDAFPPERRGTRHPANPADFLWSLRALLVALDGWVADGTEPPPSRYPRIADGTLVPPDELAVPDVPGVEAPPEAGTAPHEAYRVDYGPRFWSDGVVTKQPPELGEPFPVLVPQVGEDGNPRAGLAVPEVAVPLATYTPWNFRGEEIGAPDALADFRGSFLALPRTRSEAEAASDPRTSIEERYGSREAYLGRYAAHARELARQGYLLDEDLPELLDRAAELWETVAAR
ncbi:MAG: alpha/beta hydrolase domain-containing protein [Acidobacteriota bacterium]